MFTDFIDLLILGRGRKKQPLVAPCTCPDRSGAWEAAVSMSHTHGRGCTPFGTTVYKLQAARARAQTRDVGHTVTRRPHIIGSEGFQHFYPTLPEAGVHPRTSKT